MEDGLEPYRKAHKYMDDMLLRYVKSLNIPLGTNALNARNHVESAKEEQKKEHNEKKWRKNGVATHLLFPIMVMDKFP